MKKYFVCAMLTMSSLLTTDVFGQQSIIGELNYEFLQKLISLAKENYPRNLILKVEERRAKAAVSAAKVSYLDMVSVSYFYRPEDRAALNPNNPFIFNGFQLGVMLSPGIFFQKPYEVRQAKESHEITRLQAADYDTELETLVKSRYYDYVFALNDIKTKTTEAQAAKALFDDLRLRYERGETELEPYSAARAAASSTATALAQTEINFLKAKDLLEQLVGVKLADVK